MIDEQRAAFEAGLPHRFGTKMDKNGNYVNPDVRFAWSVYQAALESQEVQGLRDVLERCRLALEPYDDVKPRDWKSDRENLRYAHQAVCDALAQEQGGSDDA